MRVVLTREAGANEQLRAWLGDLGEVSEVPLTTTRYDTREEVAARLAATGLAGAATALVVTSARSRDYVELVASALAPGARVLAVGAPTAEALEAAGVPVTTVGTGGAAELADHVGAGPVIVLGARDAREELADRLGARGVVVAHVACYETHPRTLDASEVAALRGADVVAIGAPSAWSVARDLVAREAWVVVPGATTGAAVAADHARVLEGWGADLAARVRARCAGGGESSG